MNRSLTLTPNGPLTRLPRYLKARSNTRSLDRQATEILPRDGRFRAGLLRNVAVITRGEAQGHGLWIDRFFLSQVRAAINGSRAGIPSHYNHSILPIAGDEPEIGRLTRATLVPDTNVLRADLHLAKSARNTPDLAEYVMDLAGEDPAAFGLSIVFDRDDLAEEKFAEDHSGSGEFRSPDQDNDGNLRHARLARLHAADVVDEPAANPDGLFHLQPFGRDLDATLTYALGLTDHAPAETALLDIHPQRIREVVARFLEQHGLTIEPAARTRPDDPLAAAKRTVAEYLLRFGPDGGRWFAEGKTLAECHRLTRRKVFAEMARGQS